MVPDLHHPNATAIAHYSKDSVHSTSDMWHACCLLFREFKPSLCWTPRNTNMLR